MLIIYERLLCAKCFFSAQKYKRSGSYPQGLGGPAQHKVEFMRARLANQAALGEECGGQECLGDIEEVVREE